MPRLLSWIGEQWTWPRAYIPAISRSASALRTVLSDSIWGRPYMQHTRVDYDLARSLYRNDNPAYNLGAGFVRPIIDLTVEYAGLPYVTTEDSTRDTFLNECLHDHWAPQVQEVFTAMLRDSKTVVRFRQPRVDNPLFTEEDRMHGRIECVAPEMIDLTFDPADPELVIRAIQTHYIDFDERSEEEILTGTMPRIVEHEILEIITPQKYEFFDKTLDKKLDSWSTGNPWSFVPAWPAYNDYDSALGGGQSDIEPVMPFILAFHDVLGQCLVAHKYHSTPKAKFNLKDIYAFMKNNYPEVLDENGAIKPGAKITWSGKEIFFFGEGEDADFIEAQSVLGDSKTLLDFLIDCIAIAAEVPKWALLKAETANDKDATIKAFEKKIERKRKMFQEIIQMLCKMVLASRSQAPITVRVAWPTISLESLVSKGQAMQQIIMGLDVAASHEWIADKTVVQILSTLFPEVSSPDIEMQAAKSNVVPEVPAPAPASPTQGSQSTNGSGSKSAGRQAVATTKASNS